MEEWRKTRATKYILKYNDWKEMLQRSSSKLNPAAGTAKYGIESAMPRGGGDGHSDPVSKYVLSGFNTHNEREKRAVNVVESVMSSLNKERHKKILELWMDGLNISQTSEQTGYSVSSISDVRNKLLYMIDKKIND